MNPRDADSGIDRAVRDPLPTLGACVHWSLFAVLFTLFVVGFILVMPVLGLSPVVMLVVAAHHRIRRVLHDSRSRSLRAIRLAVSEIEIAVKIPTAPRKGHPDGRALARSFLTLAAIMLATTLPLIGQAETILVCSFTDGASLVFQETGEYFPKREPFTARLTKEQFEVVFAGLDTSAPVARGNSYEAGLHVLRRTSDGIWLAEVTLFGAVHLWTIFPEQKIAMVSKHYRGTLVYDHFGILAVGRCR